MFKTIRSKIQLYERQLTLIKPHLMGSKFQLGPKLKVCAKEAHLVLDVGLLVFVEMNLEESGAVQPDPDALANDLGGVDQVVEDCVVNGNQGAGPGTKMFTLTKIMD